MKSLTSDLSDLEQCSLRNCFLMHGVQENANKNTNDSLKDYVQGT